MAGKSQRALAARQAIRDRARAAEKVADAFIAADDAVAAATAHRESELARLDEAITAAGVSRNRVLAALADVLGSAAEAARTVGVPERQVQAAIRESDPDDIAELVRRLVPQWYQHAPDRPASGHGRSTVRPDEEEPSDGP